MILNHKPLSMYLPPPRR